jgi:glycosyltransferase involved in cell wall biosynthesis
MKLSVSLITFNQAPFIAQAIEGALAQQTKFEYEILIGEDGSTDGTRQIVTQYKEKYPDRLRLLLNDRSQVSYANGKPTGNWNFANNITNARGEYIALLDGDDYWTSPAKLQKQVDFLERNRDCALCFHNVQILDESEPNKYQLHNTRTKPRRLSYDVMDLLSGNFMHTCSVVFRARLFPEFPRWFFQSAFGDWPLHVLNAQHGRIGYLHEVLAVYRRHAGGVLSGQGKSRVVADSIQAAELLRDCLTPPQKKRLDRTVAKWYRELIELYGQQGDHESKKKFAEKYLQRFPERKSWFLLKERWHAAVGSTPRK